MKNEKLIFLKRNFHLKIFRTFPQTPPPSTTPGPWLISVEEARISMGGPGIARNALEKDRETWEIFIRKVRQDVPFCLSNKSYASVMFSYLQNLCV